RLEKFRRIPLSKNTNVEALYDRMTEQVYTEALTTFNSNSKPEPLTTIPLIENGQDELKKVEIAAFDDFERKIIYEYFAHVENRNPTYAEILDWANANSEHCRHWLFGSRWIIDGVEMPATLFRLVKAPWEKDR